MDEQCRTRPPSYRISWAFERHFIRDLQVCDGELDCGEDDDSDETNCTLCDEGSVVCGNFDSNVLVNKFGACITVDQICDGHDDCGDGSDEPPFGGNNSDLIRFCNFTSTSSAPSS